MDNFLACATFLVGTLVLSPMAEAQPPLEFRNSAEAVRRYESDQVDSLRQRCVAVSADTLLGRGEIAIISNGFVSIQEDPVAGIYVILGYDERLRRFILVDGQRLDSKSSLKLKLALPRDYSRCRLVRSSTGTEQVEVVHIARNNLSASRALNKLMAEAAKLSEQIAKNAKPLVCRPVDSSESNPRSLQLRFNGKTLEFPRCHEAAQNLIERMSRIVHKVYER